MPCDDELYDEDATWIENSIKLLNCTPSFFKAANSRFGMNEIDISNETCNKEGLSEFDSKYAPKTKFEKIAKFYLRPCIEMESSVTSKATTLPKTRYVSSQSYKGSYDVELTLLYRVQHYKYASNEKSFTLFTLWSQVGGLIGIFLGYSLLQLPELLGFVSTEMKRIFLKYFEKIHRSSETSEA